MGGSLELQELVSLANMVKTPSLKKKKINQGVVACAHSPSYSEAETGESHLNPEGGDYSELVRHCIAW